jgi:hypothetical protein
VLLQHVLAVVPLSASGGKVYEKKNINHLTPAPPC